MILQEKKRKNFKHKEIFRIGGTFYLSGKKRKGYADGEK